jgi:hypothetical protein
LARPAAPKPTLARLFREVLAGLVVFACLVAVIFALLRWRTNTPEQHLNFEFEHQVPGQSHD